jgi:hypothetical protein
LLTPIHLTVNQRQYQEYDVMGIDS